MSYTSTTGIKANTTTDPICIPVRCGSFTTEKLQDTVWCGSVLQLPEGCGPLKAVGSAKLLRPTSRQFPST